MTSILNVTKKKESPFKHLFIFKSDGSQLKNLVFSFYQLSRAKYVVVLLTNILTNILTNKNIP